MTKIYLISPEKIELNIFSKSLQNALQTNLVPAFQLRLKGYQENEVEKISKELKQICHDNNCLFLLNDNFNLALKIAADGVHLGADDGAISQARKNSSKNFIIGASCYDSRHSAVEAAEQGADYLSFGAFFPSKTKNSKGKPTVEILQWALEMFDLPIVGIGGINNQNCKILAQENIDFVAVISYIWQHPQGEAQAVKILSQALNT